MIFSNVYAQDFGIQQHYMNRLAGFTWEQLMEEFGTPSAKIERRIGFDYPFYITDPDYLRYFSREEMIKSLVIYIVVWEFKFGESERWLVDAYLSYDNGKWRTFFSLEYNPDVVSIP